MFINRSSSCAFLYIFCYFIHQTKNFALEKKWKLVTVYNFFWDWQLFLPFLYLMKKSESCLRIALACLSQCDAFYLFGSSVISISIIFLPLLHFLLKLNLQLSFLIRFSLNSATFSAICYAYRSACLLRFNFLIKLSKGKRLKASQWL